MRSNKLCEPLVKKCYWDQNRRKNRDNNRIAPCFSIDFPLSSVEGWGEAGGPMPRCFLAIPKNPLSSYRYFLNLC